MPLALFYTITRYFLVQHATVLPGIALSLGRRTLFIALSHSGTLIQVLFFVTLLVSLTGLACSVSQVSPTPWCRSFSNAPLLV